MKKGTLLLILFWMAGIVFTPLIARAEVKDPLLQKLIEKGTISTEEAEGIQSKSTPWVLKDLKIGVLAYIDYSFGDKNHDGTDFNKFSLTRGYLNVKKGLTPWMKTRWTSDIHQDSTGDYKLRMKYLYMDFLPPNLLAPYLTDNVVRVGLGHTPWLDFLEHIYIYRMQGTTFQERNGLFNSSDLGVSLIGNIGGKLSHEAQTEVGYHTPFSGRYGTYHIGVYNGGGYHASEANQNKVVEGRITLRPLPDIVPGLQFTYFGISGDGNTAAGPAWRNNAGLLSYQNKYVVFDFEYVDAKGKQSGADELKRKGYSFFVDFRPPVYRRASIFARYDTFDNDTTVSNNKNYLTIVGLGYRIYKNNILVATYEKAHAQPAGQDDDIKGQVVLQVSY